MLNKLYLLLLAMIPTIEARFAIPFGISQYKLPPLESFLIACTGTFIAIIISIITLYKIVPLINWIWFKKLIQKIFSYTQKKHSKMFQQVEEISLITFIAIPFPGTGIYSGILISYLLGLSAKKAFIYSTMGMLISSSLTTLGTIGVINIF